VLSLAPAELCRSASQAQMAGKERAAMHAKLAKCKGKSGRTCFDSQQTSVGAHLDKRLPQIGEDGNSI
jgi:hypothetical protein